MKYLPLLIIISNLLMACCRDSLDSGLIEINTQKEYPVSNLKLSDVAQVTYVPLRMGKDSILFGNIGSKGVCVFDKTIFLLSSSGVSQQSKIIQYDMSGNPLSVISRIGNGPEEYIHIRNFFIDKKRKEIFLWDAQLNKLLVYDFHGNFKRGKKTTNSYSTLCEVNDDYMVGYQAISKWWHPQMNKSKDRHIPTISFIEKDSLSIADTDFDYSKYHDMSSLLIINHLSKTSRGVYFTNQRCDTVFFIDKYRTVSPRIVDKTPSKTKKSQIFPVIETEQNIFLSNEQEMKNQKYSRIDHRFYVYDKRKRKIFRLKTDLEKYKDFSLALANNQIALTQLNTTQNSEYAFTLFTPVFLKENQTFLPATLQQITKTLKEDDNPVLMLIKFK